MSSSSSPARSMALAIAPKFTAVLSICGSLGIVIKVVFNESRRNHTMHRIVLGMSICDILAGIWYFTGTWAIPAGTMSWFGDGETEQIFWAAGDEDGVSCSFAGFFNQFAVASPLYNTTLSIYFLLVVNYGWTDRQIAKIEWILHGIPVGYALITSIFAVVADLYGHVEWTCWILPNGAMDDDQELTPIQSKFQWIQWIFLFGVVWLCIIVVTTVFVVLYRKMKALERIMKRYTYTTTTGNMEVSTFQRNTTLDKTTIDIEETTTSNSNSATKRNEEEDAESPETQSKTVWFTIPKTDKTANDANGRKQKASAQREVAKKSKKIAVQGLLYVGAFYITWMFPTISRITELAVHKNYFPIQFLDTFLIPLQGFFNFLIYSRPTYLKYRRRGKSFWEAFRTALFEINVD